MVPWLSADGSSALYGLLFRSEKTLLEKYFHALSMNDNQTMASMAVEPLAIDAG
jgi:hypothetical protein